MSLWVKESANAKSGFDDIDTVGEFPTANPDSVNGSLVCLIRVDQLENLFVHKGL